MRKIAALLLVLGACKPDQPPAPPAPTGLNCASAEKQLQSCASTYPEAEEVLQTLAGETYAQVCLRVEKEGRVSLGADCIVKSSNCEEVVECLK